MNKTLEQYSHRLQNINDVRDFHPIRYQKIHIEILKIIKDLTKNILIEYSIDPTYNAQIENQSNIPYPDDIKNNLNNNIIINWETFIIELLQRKTNLDIGVLCNR